MLYVELKQARAQLLELLDLALQGEEVILTQKSQPVAMLVPVPTTPETETEGDQDPAAIEEDSEPGADPGPLEEASEPISESDDTIR